MDIKPPGQTPGKDDTTGEQGNKKKKLKLSLDPNLVPLARTEIEGGSSSLGGGRVSPGKATGAALGSANLAIASTHATAQQESEAFLAKMHQGLNSGELCFLEDKRTISAPLKINDRQGVTKAIFKPVEKEVSQTRDGIHLGEGIYGELIGYQFGKEYGVPLTSLVYMSCAKKEGSYVYEGQPKLGSLQEWSPEGEHIASIPVDPSFKDPLQSIAILDLRCLNSDRHGNNILYDKAAHRLIPIDHGGAAPRLMDVDAYNFFWMHSPLSKEPFSQTRMDDIRKIDPVQDRKTIKTLIPSFPKERLDSVELSSTILTRGAEKGLTPFEIGSFFYNLQGSEHAPLATIIYHEALIENKSGSEDGFTEIINKKVDFYIDAYKSNRMSPQDIEHQNYGLSPQETTSDPVCNYCMAMNKKMLKNKK